MGIGARGDDVMAERNWFGQPRGLTILFLTEMWSSSPTTECVRCSSTT